MAFVLANSGILYSCELVLAPNVEFALLFKKEGIPVTFPSIVMPLSIFIFFSRPDIVSKGIRGRRKIPDLGGVFGR